MPAPQVPPTPRDSPMLYHDGPILYRDGPWLAWAAQQRRGLDWFAEYGRNAGFPRKIDDWSPGMVARAVAARVQADNPCLNGAAR